ncbi:putative bifunctional enzyme with isomerase/decarboxylase activity, partial [Jimgerdemannia flammicorona]
FNVPALISFLSQGTTLQPGDVIVTGTPEVLNRRFSCTPGVGFAKNPPVFLQDGDEVECFVEKIGVIKNTIVHEKKAGSKL